MDRHDVAVTDRPYHHGDARNALLQAAAALLEQGGAASLSLRAIAERAGLSRQAPYNHFADKEELLAELVRAGFERLARETAAAQLARRPVRRLARAAEAYIAFAQGSPALFRLMFGREFVDFKRHEAARQAAGQAFDRLVAVVAGLAPPDRVEGLSLVAWCLMHGYATLCLEASIEGSAHRAARADLFARTVQAIAAQPDPAGVAPPRPLSWRTD